VENVTNRTTASHGMFSLPGAEAYASAVGNMVDNFVTVTRMVNKTVFKRRTNQYITSTGK
jgi:hypothetical protein